MRSSYFLSTLLAISLIGFVSTVSAQTLDNSVQLAPSARSHDASNVWLENMTWPEVASAMQNGFRSIIIPTAGIEQSGPHMPLSKHRRVLSYTAPKIAVTLGNTLVAPIIDFVPEGDIANLTEHMAYPGTISVPPRVFAGVLEYTARSLVAHGFTHIFLIGDSLPNQKWQAKVAEELQAAGLPVFHISHYYANDKQDAIMASQGYSEPMRGGHAGLRDTAELIAAETPDVSSVRREWLTNIPIERYNEMGTYGDLTKANRALGAMLLNVKIEQAVEEICGLAPTLPGCRQIEK